MAAKNPRPSNGGYGPRFYPIPGEDRELPSVTTILQVISKPALVNWAAKVERDLVSQTSADLYEDLAGTPKMGRLAYLSTLEGRLGKVKAHRKELEKAGNIGRQVHALIEWNLRRSLGQEPGPEPRIVDAAQWAFMAYEDWAKRSEFKPILIEQVVYSLKYGYAGTMDAYGTVSGRPVVVDFKSGKSIYPESHLQNAAYQVALEEMGHGQPVGGLIVRLPKSTEDPDFEVVTVEDRQEVFPVFLHAIDLWWWQHRRELRRKESLERSEARE